MAFDLISKDVIVERADDRRGDARESGGGERVCTIIFSGDARRRRRRRSAVCETIDRSVGCRVASRSVGTSRRAPTSLARGVRASSRVETRDKEITLSRGHDRRARRATTQPRRARHRPSRSTRPRTRGRAHSRDVRRRRDTRPRPRARMSLEDDFELHLEAFMDEEHAFDGWCVRARARGDDGGLGRLRSEVGADGTGQTERGERE